MKRKCYALVLALALLFSTVSTGFFGMEGAAAEPKLLAFTFDDGPSYNTPALLDGLKERGAAVTFFMTGVNGSSGIANQESLLDRMRDEGHQLANHTYSHIMPFDTQSAATISSQVGRVEELLFQHMGGSYTDMVRTPGGATGGLVKSTVPAPIITWSVDTLDWKYHNANTVYNNILSDAYDGAIVLLHDLYSTSVQGVLRAMDTLKSQGYEFVTVSEPRLPCSLYLPGRGHCRDPGHLLFGGRPAPVLHHGRLPAQPGQSTVHRAPHHHRRHHVHCGGDRPVRHPHPSCLPNCGWDAPGFRPPVHL